MKKKLNKFEKDQLYRMLNKPEKVVDLANKFRIELIQQETEAEREFRLILSKLKVRYEFQRIVYAGKSFYIIDFYLPKYEVGIEIDGYHHTTQEGIKNDKSRTKALRKVGLKEIYRFMNNEVLDRTACIEKLKDLLFR